MIAALFVDGAGVYSQLPDIELWTMERDARRYPGPYPVVAHPPCATWSIMGQCRGYTGGDRGEFASALRAVRLFGGVLEHPRHTRAWKTFELTRPRPWRWTPCLTHDDAWVCELDQQHYGTPHRKPTWLYYVGPPPPPMRWGLGEARERSVARGFGKRMKRVEATPPSLASALVALARNAQRVLV